MSAYRRTRTSSRGPPSRQRRAEEDDEGRVEGRMTVNELEPRGSCSRPRRLSSTFLGSHELRPAALLRSLLLAVSLFTSFILFFFSFFFSITREEILGFRFSRETFGRFYECSGLPRPRQPRLSGDVRADDDGSLRGSRIEVINDNEFQPSSFVLAGTRVAPWPEVTKRSLLFLQSPGWNATSQHSRKITV